MLKKILITLITLVIFFTPNVSAATFYVSPSGNDSANGSQTTPWKTIQNSACKLNPGDTLIVMPGNYNENPELNITKGCKSGTPQNPITIKALNNYKSLSTNLPLTTTQESQLSKITGNFYGWRLRLDGLSNWTIDGLAATNFLGAGFIFYAGNNAGKPQANIENVTLKNLYIRNGCTLANCADSGTVPDSQNGSGTHMIAFGSQKYQYLAKNLYVTDNYIRDTVTGAGAIGGAYNENLTVFGKVDGVIIENNTLENVSYIGIDVIGAWGCVNHDGKPETPPICIWYDQPKNIVIRGNKVINVKNDVWGNAQGIYLDRAFENVLIENNYVSKANTGISPGFEPGWYRDHTNQVDGRTLPYTKNILVRNNTVLEGSSPLRVGLFTASCDVSTTPSCTAHGNNDPNYNPVFDKVSLTHNVGTIRTDTQWTATPLSWGRTKNSDALNNVFVNKNAQLLIYTDLKAIRNNWRSDGNIFYTNKGNGVFEFGQEQYSYNFQSYKSNSRQDANSYFSEPVFNNTSTGDYKIKSGQIGHEQGIKLTVTTSAGSGKTVTVQDAKFFYDGWGIPGEKGDRIIIGTGGSKKEAYVTKADYTNNTLTIDRSISWVAGEEVNYYFEGARPSIGRLSDSFYNHSGNQNPTPTPSTSEPTPTPSTTPLNKYDVVQDGVVDILDIIDVIKYLFN